MSRFSSRRRRRGWLATSAVALSVLFGAATGVSGCGDEDVTPAAPCDAGRGAFVQRALLAIDGRRAHSRAEVQVWNDVLAKMQNRGVDAVTARRYVARAMIAESKSYRERWTLHLMDMLQVVRAQFVRDVEWNLVQASRCFGDITTGALVDPNDKGALAKWLVENGPDVDTPPFPDFNMGRAIASSIVLDDVSPMFRAHLFHMLVYPIAGANVDPLELEAARRRDFTRLFEEAYVNRDTVCLECHNSFESRTPDRTFPVPGLLELSVYGSNRAEDERATYEAVFRVDGVRHEIADEGVGPWGWDQGSCGTFTRPDDDDPLGATSGFASVSGPKTSVWDLEASLHRGFDEIRGVGLSLDADGVPSSPDAAFAYLVSMNIAEKVWEEIMGSPLTIPHHFPRNEHQRDTLERLTNSFVKNNFSLKSLIEEVVVDPLFNLPAADSECGTEAYELAPVLNPWSTDNVDETERANAVGDAVHHISSRVVQNALFSALEWGTPSAFPQSVEDEEFMASLGFFIVSSKPGFRGFGFQAKLALEVAYGACEPQASPDYVAKLTTRALKTNGATVADAVVALKDRLIGETTITEPERGPLEALVGQPLDAAPEAAGLEEGLRLVCGAYISSPQFLLSGLPVEVGIDVPLLTASEHRYNPSCSVIAERFETAEVPFIINCLAGELTVSKR